MLYDLILNSTVFIISTYGMNYCFWNAIKSLDSIRFRLQNINYALETVEKLENERFCQKYAKKILKKDGLNLLNK